MARTTLKQAGALCAKWLGKDPGQSIPCRSTAVGRSLELKVPGRIKQSYAIESCAVPRLAVRPSKRCKTAFIGRTDGGMFPGERTYIDGGKVRNAQRTPRPFHPALDVEWVAGHMVGGPADLMDNNRIAGADSLEGLDLPFPHRAGSSPCCPTSAISVGELRQDLRWAYEARELWLGLRTRLAKLAKHLAGPRHGIAGLPATVAADDFAGANAIIDAGTMFCEKYLRSWQYNAEESLKLRKVERKKERSRKASAKRRESKARSEGGRKAVEALQRQSRTGRKLSALKPAGAILSAGSLVEVRPSAGNPDHACTYPMGRVIQVLSSNALVMIGRKKMFIPLRRLKVIV